MTEMICIICPKGCRLHVDEHNGYAVTGNACPRGAEYGRNELQNPQRVVTSTVRLVGDVQPRLPVKTDKPIPKDKVFDCIELIDTVVVHAPINTGDILLPNILGTDASIIATKSIKKVL